MGLFRTKSKSKEEAAGSGSGSGGGLPADINAAITSNAAVLVPPPEKPSYARGYVELGTIDYVNLTPDGRHGDFHAAVNAAAATGKPIFANFVEWSGWRGCKDAGAKIFADPVVRRAANELFVPCAFNTWDRSSPKHQEAFKKWSAGLASSWWGYLRIVDSEGKQIISGTRQITDGSRHSLEQVKQVIRDALEDLGIDVPDYLAA